MPDKRTLEQIYAQATRDFQGLLLSVDITNFDEAQAAAIEKRARRMTDALNIQAGRWIKREIPKAYAVGAAISQTSLEILGKKPNGKARPGAGPKRLEAAAITYLVKANASMRRVVERYLQMALLAGRTYKEGAGQVQEFDFTAHAADIKKMATEAVKAEEARGTLKKRLMDYIRADIRDGKLIDIKGKTWKATKYAELVSRTVYREAQTAATKDLCFKYSNDLVQWSDHATNCAPCDEYEGKIYSLSGNDPNYPPLPASPPLHPNCKHSLLPTSREAIIRRGLAPTQVIKPGTAKKPAKPRKKKGWEPAKTLKEAEDWLKAQGIDYVDFTGVPGSYITEGVDLEIANLMNKNIYELLTKRKMTFTALGPYRKMYNLVSNYPKPNLTPDGFLQAITTWQQGGPAKRNFTRQVFSYNPNGCKTMARLKQSIGALENAGIQKLQTPDGVIIHEIGHIIDYQQPLLKSELWAEWRARVPNGMNPSPEWAFFKNRLKDKVGSYIVSDIGPMKDQAEWFAECFRLHRTGNLPKDLEWMSDIFKKWGW